MESSLKLKERFHSAMDSIREMEAMQQLKAKWEELDPQSRTYLKFASFGGGLLLSLMMIFSTIWSVHSTKTDYHEKRALLVEIQAANDEVRKLRESIPPSALNSGNDAAGGDTTPWSSYFETVASNSGVDKASLVVSSEKPGATSDQSKELMFDVSIKHVSIKQVVRFAFNLENGARPVKVRHLSIDTQADPTGYMDADLSLSAFTLVTQK